MSLSYSRQAFEAMAKQLSSLTTAPAKVATAIVGSFKKVLEHQFATGVDPDGKPWKELSAATLRKHGPPPFVGADMLADSDVRAVGARVVMTVPSPAEYHQETRQILPSNDGGLPDLYTIAANASGDAAITKLLK